MAVGTYAGVGSPSAVYVERGSRGRQRIMSAATGREQRGPGCEPKGPSSSLEVRRARALTLRSWRRLEIGVVGGERL